MVRASPELIAVAQSGNVDAITELLALCQPDLMRFARKTCNTSEDAEDAVQVALWILSRKIGTLHRIAAFSTWLFRIVERECYRRFRCIKQQSDVSEEEMLNIAQTQSPEELKRDLSKAIAAIPHDYRTVLILRDVDSLTAPEVAEQLGLSVEAVKSRLHRARTMVREQLKANGY